ncbi:hypothetical protein P152DRAFT_401692 [Eremomyces bilateralis CBS 781.70]|uniref:Voltage-gated hydrogen channel 1 n=1 Tax=Eremomyces bilateralis CBS 781.70 TaxID=1392243 RepID=A0A6G1FWW3_9PEZI|nr:uncharacterized protein P152DRAFT_401692 [Eremomyces bilateralis CBS 781.70]KAF1810192.1 hypothetical protein P152DRAFT_401692 [Eremomyces bilateralis CBS 781.70]
MINLYTCEQRCNGIQSKAASHALGTLGNVSFAFSCLFMAELVFSIWAFGAQYFRSWFRVFDATVIIGNLVVDTLLRGVTKDAASLAVILRLWRLYKIGKEVSGGAAGLMEVLNGRIEVLEKENHRLRTQLTSLSPELDY